MITRKLLASLLICATAFLAKEASATPLNKCEFLLHRKSDIAQARDTIHIALTDFKNLETYFISHEAKDSALSWLGLDSVSPSKRHNVSLRIYGSPPHDPTEVRLIYKDEDDTRTIKRLKLPRHLLPLFAWQRIPFTQARFDQIIETDFLGGTTYKLAPSQVKELEIGLTLEEFPSGRLMIGVKSDLENHSYHLWADVDCELVREFTTSASTQHIRTENGWLCRIPLLMAVSISGIGPNYNPQK